MALADEARTGQNSPMGWFSKNKQRLKDLLAMYGWVAAAVWFSIFGLSLCGFALALSTGLEASVVYAMLSKVYTFLNKIGISISPGALERTGVWGLAYGLTQIAKPLRIAATVVLTPIVARWVGKTPSKASEE